MISASHNPMPDNGIKLFAAGGHKLPDAVEDEIEAHVARPGGADDAARPATTSAASRRARRARPLPRPLLAATPTPARPGCTSSSTAPTAPRRTPRPAPTPRRARGSPRSHAEPDGWNINDGVGSTHLDGLCKAVVAEGADLGIAHDGDADRCLAVAADGTVVDGDQILGVLALAHARARRARRRTPSSPP